ncbi:hypothetical protein BC941DRAFT_476962 [Chlamydoabsidia padenii]|nr:hypothetical protein BC941DRAFT_476962 [Chlamydoabsidia padenii]
MDSRMKYDVYMDNSLVALPYKDIVMEIIEAVHQQTGYGHCFQRVGKNILAYGTIFYASCVFRCDLRSHLDVNQRKHQVLSLPMFDGKGTHGVGHPCYSLRRIQLTDQERRFTTGLSIETHIRGSPRHELCHKKRNFLFLFLFSG